MPQSPQSPFAAGGSMSSQPAAQRPPPQSSGPPQSSRPPPQSSGPPYGYSMPQRPPQRQPQQQPAYGGGQRQPYNPPQQAQPAQRPPNRWSDSMQPQQPQGGGNFKGYMRDMRQGYRGSMQAAGLPKGQIQQKMKAMRKDQRANKSQIANQYMREQTQRQQQGQMQGDMRYRGNEQGGNNRWQQQIGSNVPGRPANPGDQEYYTRHIGNSGPIRQAPQQGGNRWQQAQGQMGNAILSNPNLSGAEQQQAMGQVQEQFNQRGYPTSSRANLLPQQQQGSWAQRMSGGMRGAPGSAPMPRRSNMF